MRAKCKKWLIISAISLVIAGGAFGYYCGYYVPAKRAATAAAAKKLATDGGDVDRTFKVKRDDLVIGLLLGGYVNASQKHKLALRANYSTKLLWVIDENTKVKKGDLLAKFETDNLIEQIENQEIELENLQKELEIARETEKITISSNMAELQQAEENLAQAEDALRKYRRFERKNTRDELDLSISDAEVALNSAEDNYTTIRDGEVSTNSDENASEKKREQLKSAQQKIEKAETTLSSAQDKRKVFRRYDNPSKIARLENSLRQNQLKLRQVKISVASKEVQQRRSINNYRRRIRRVEEQLRRYREYLTMMKLTAPVDGVVIYGDPDRRWNKLDVKAGMDVGKGQVLFTIPEMSNLIVDFDLPEQSRSRVKLGDRVLVFPDSLPGKRFFGRISHIDTLPVNMILWDSSSPKVYKAKVKFERQSSQLVNGMSAQINIITRTIPKTLFIPVEAVFEDNDRFFVYKATLTGTKEIDVKIGAGNDNFVQITQGLEEGDVVYLYRPYQKSEKK